MGTIVMKFGGASVRTPQSFKRAAQIIAEKRRQGYQVVVVVSAMGDTTDELIALALQVNPNPPQREYDMLVTVGERISIALLAMALFAEGEKAISYTGSQSGIITTPNHCDAQIIDVRPTRILRSLEEDKIVIVAGFQGVSRGGEITTLGRGGSDTTAVALGAALGAQCVEFYKDVPGVFSADPHANPAAVPYPSLTYAQADAIIEAGAEILSARSLWLARRNCLPMRILSFKSEDSGCVGTKICDDSSALPAIPIYEEVCSTVLCASRM